MTNIFQNTETSLTNPESFRSKLSITNQGAITRFEASVLRLGNKYKYLSKHLSRITKDQVKNFDLVSDATVNIHSIIIETIPSISNQEFFKDLCNKMYIYVTYGECIFKCIELLIRKNYSSGAMSVVSKIIDAGINIGELKPEAIEEKINSILEPMFNILLNISNDGKQCRFTDKFGNLEAVFNNTLTNYNDTVPTTDNYDLNYPIRQSVEDLSGDQMEYDNVN